MPQEIVKVISRWTSVIIFILAGLRIGLPAQAFVRFQGTESQLTTDPADQFDRAISGVYTVYTDHRGPDADNVDVYCRFAGSVFLWSSGWRKAMSRPTLTGTTIRLRETGLTCMISTTWHPIG